MKALLVLEDGFCLQGKSFTGDFETGGEVIFNTGMTGYQEVLTDPSYYGQMVCMTYPLIGNYGITAEDMESGRVHMRALLVKECCKEPSNWRSKESLPDFLKRWNVPGMEGLDTRALTRHLRINGAMRGIISTRDLDVESLRRHYNRTLRCWNANFQAHKDEVRKMFDEQFVRMWELYLCACAATFYNGIIDLHQILWSKGVNNELPMTRWY